MNPEPGEQFLVEQAKHDRQAFARLYDRYVDAIYAYVYQQTRDVQLAEDVTAETFEKALRHIGRFRWRGISFGAWLYRIAGNLLASHYRRQRFWAPWVQEVHSNAADGPEDCTEAGERATLLWAAYTSLSERDRRIIGLRILSDLPTAQVAEILGCSPQNVYLRLHRALSRLRERFLRWEEDK